MATENPASPLGSLDVRHTRRRNWLIKGVGPQRRAEIIEALKGVE